MLQISIQDDLNKLSKSLKDVQQKQIPFAAAIALTRTARLVKEAEREEMADVFDRPTKFTLNSLYVKAATKHKLEALVWLKDWAPKGTAAARYLLPQIQGGQRKLKGFEVLLNRRGILPDGYYTVPGKSAKLDRHGNISKGQLNQILSYSRSQRDNAQNTKLETGRRSTKARFIVFEEREGKPGGIWQMKYGGLLPVLIFVKRPSFKKRFDFEKVADKTQKLVFTREFYKAYEYAQRTARA